MSVNLHPAGCDSGRHLAMMMTVTTSLKGHVSLSSPWWTVAIQDTCYKNLPILKHSPFLGTSPMWQRHHYLKSLQVPRPWLHFQDFGQQLLSSTEVGLCCLCNRETHHKSFNFRKQTKERKITQTYLKKPLKPCLKPNQFIFKPFIFSLNYENLTIKKTSSQLKIIKTICF